MVQDEMISLGEQYFRGVLAAYLGESIMCCSIPEWQIDVIKENISHYCETLIDHSQLSNQEKEDQKRQMKQSLEVYIQGVKDEMREKGKDSMNMGRRYFQFIKDERYSNR